MSPKKDKKESDDKPGLNINLPLEFLEQYEKDRAEAMKNKPGFKSDNNPTVTQFKYDEMEKGYKEKIQKLQEDKEKLREDRDQARTERDSAKGKLNAISKQKDSVESELSSVKARLSDAEGENAQLRKENKENFDATTSQEYKSLNARASELEKKLGKAENDNSDLRKEKEDLSRQIDDLKRRLEDALNRVPEPVIEEKKQPDGNITWSSPTEFRSDLFTSPKYRVMLERHGKYISFKTDVEGKCVCENNTICIPAMNDYLPFKEGTYDAHMSGDTIILFL